MLGNKEIAQVLGGRSPDLVVPYLARMPKALSLGDPLPALPSKARHALEAFFAPLLGAEKGV